VVDLIEFPGVGSSEAEEDVLSYLPTTFGEPLLLPICILWLDSDSVALDETICQGVKGAAEARMKLFTFMMQRFCIQVQNVFVETSRLGKEIWNCLCHFMGGHSDAKRSDQGQFSSLVTVGGSYVRSISYFVHPWHKIPAQEIPGVPFFFPTTREGTMLMMGRHRVGDDSSSINKWQNWQSLTAACSWIPGGSR
jgi:hypothetical protein